MSSDKRSTTLKDEAVQQDQARKGGQNVVGSEPGNPSGTGKSGKASEDHGIKVPGGNSTAATHPGTPTAPSPDKK